MERVPTEVSHKIYGAPEERFCPAKVYEFVQDEKTNQHELQINA
jgi:electron-transferring-flavoprotein dehydrogenase